jgi:general secretion pathway protein G
MRVVNTNQRKRIARRNGAFTLIELLLVMVIITILATLLVPRVVGHLQKAKITAAQADLSTLKQSLTAFYIDNGRYPTTSEGLGALITMPAGCDPTKWVKTLDKNTIPNDPWGHPYVYRFPGSNGDDFDLLSTGPSGQEGAADEIKAD